MLHGHDEMAWKNVSNTVCSFKSFLYLLLICDTKVVPWRETWVYWCCNIFGLLQIYICVCWMLCWMNVIPVQTYVLLAFSNVSSGSVWDVIFELLNLEIHDWKYLELLPWILSRYKLISMWHFVALIVICWTAELLFYEIKHSQLHDFALLSQLSKSIEPHCPKPSHVDSHFCHCLKM